MNHEPKLNHISEDSIKLLINGFYGKVRKEKSLGHIFINAIGKTDDEWRPHLERMCDFWSSLMLTSGRYHGNPIKKHMDLPTFDKGLFDVWLALFEETAHEIYTDDIVELYMDKGRRVAQSLQLALYYRPEDSIQ